MNESQANFVRPYKVWSVLLLGTIVCLDILHRFFPRSAMVGAFDDDFFYYAKIASNLAHGGGSTFDGMHRTNGYHPLWLLVLTCFSLLPKDGVIFPLVTATTLLALGAIFLLSLGSLKRLGVVSEGRYVIATLIVFQSELLLRGGMEIVLALPLIFLLLYAYLDAEKYDAAFFLRAGGLSSLCVLARLDSVILIMLLFLIALFRQGAARATVMSVVSFACGLIPVWAYLIFNKVSYESFTPISAQAKQLRMHHTVQWEPFRSLVEPLTAVRLLVAIPGILCALVLGVWLLRRRGAAVGRAGIVLWAVALFPLLQLGALCVLSDWALWYWYFYPLVLSSFGCLAALAGGRRIAPRVWVGFAVGVSVVGLGYTAIYNLVSPPRKNALFLTARDIAGFAATHPGLYAMGDRSGTVGYMLSSPMIQLEGLTMDKAYVERLRGEPSLNAMLGAYGVQYYVSTGATVEGGCYRVQEPIQAGADSARMVGRFCQQPVVTFTRGRFVTRIFAVGGRGGA